MNPALHLGIEVFADQAPDLGAVLQFIGTMPEDVRPYTELGTIGVIYFKNPGKMIYGTACLSLTSARGLEACGDSITNIDTIAMLRGELQARMCPRQVLYMGIDGACSPGLKAYLAREIPRLMRHLETHATALLVPCVGPWERAHLLADAQEFPAQLEEALRIMGTA